MSHGYFVGATVTILVAVLSTTALAADRFWDGSVSGQWTDVANWSDGVEPGPADFARFGTAGVTNNVVTLGAIRSIADMIVTGIPSAGSYQFQQTGGSQLAVTGQVSFNSAGVTTPISLSGFQLNANALGVFNLAALNLVNSAHISATNFQIVNPGASVNIDTGATLLLPAGGSVSGSLTLQNTGELELTGGILMINGGMLQLNRDFALPAGRTISVNTGGDIISTDYLDIGAAGAGSFIVDGPGSTVTIGSGTSFFTDWGRNGHAATVTFSNSAAADYNRGLQVAAFGAGSSARVNINSGASVNVDQFLSTGGAGNASVTLAGGSLVCTGTAGFANGTVVSYSAGNFSVGGAVTMSGDARILLATGGDKIVSVGELSMSDTSKIDLSDNEMFVGYSGAPPLEAIRAFIAAGYNGGNWLGDRITSSAAAANPGYALGYDDTAALTGALVAIRVVYTRFGDADLSGTVNLDDFNRLASNFNTPGKFWSQGNFNYDAAGLVNLDDFNLLAGNFNLSAGPDAVVDPEDWAALAAAIPEPSAFVFTGVAASAAMCLRRRRDNA